MQRESRTSTGPGNSYNCPYPFQLRVKKVNAVSFCWDELCDKMRKESEKVGDYKISTMGGKPATPSTTPPTQVVPKQEHLRQLHQRARVEEAEATARASEGLASARFSISTWPYRCANVCGPCTGVVAIPVEHFLKGCSVCANFSSRSPHGVLQYAGSFNRGVQDVGFWQFGFPSTCTLRLEWIILLFPSFHQLWSGCSDAKFPQ